MIKMKENTNESEIINDNKKEDDDSDEKKLTKI